MTALLDWYETVRRPLPWRETRDPYALLVSEVMLQQTQAARVIPYYTDFLADFPTPRTLADAPLEDVLRAWTGLGYPRRAKALQQAAAHVAEHGWPADLTELPGVGPYTAAAVGAFAFDRQTAAVDTNVKRVLERSAGRTLAPKALQAAADAAVPPGRAADHNQAMMELGATVCTARAAHCSACPIAADCVSAFAVQIAPRRRRNGTRFEDTDRYARGRVLRSVLHGEPDGLDPERRERALAGLRADGLVSAR